MRFGTRLSLSGAEAEEVKAELFSLLWSSDTDDTEDRVGAALNRCVLLKKVIARPLSQYLNRYYFPGILGKLLCC